jgi:hypothetical protein
MELIAGECMRMEESMSTLEVSQRATMLLKDADTALVRGEFNEAIEYIKAARTLIDGLEQTQIVAKGVHRPRRKLSK